MEHISSILPRVVAGLERRRPACWSCSQYGELRKEMVDGMYAVFWYCLSCRQRLVYDGRLYQPTDQVRMDEIERAGC